MGVLRRQLHVEPGEVIDFAYEAPSVRRAVGAGYDSTVARCAVGEERLCRIEAAIRAAGSREPAERAADHPLIVVGCPQPIGRQIISRIGDCSGAEARGEVHFLVDAGALRGKDVLVADILILKILSHVVEAIVWTLQWRAGT